MVYLLKSQKRIESMNDRKRVELVNGDITKYKADVTVSPVNPYLNPCISPGSVQYGTKKAGGAGIFRELESMKKRENPDHTKPDSVFQTEKNGKPT